jgi:cellulose synthase (UDP-forming)
MSEARVRTRTVFTRWDFLLFALLTGMTYTAILSSLIHWFSYGDWRGHPVAFWGVTLLILSRLATHQLRWWVLPCMRRPITRVAPAGWRVGVATTFVPGAESIAMLAETVRALVTMDYPHDTWVLDEGDDPQVKALCRRLGAFHFSRKASPRYQTTAGTFQARSKHGNYNAWCDAIGFTRYEILAAFDPDHVPAPTFLTEVLGYFHDPEVGYVQAAQVYYNQQASFIARGAAEETYGYYSSVQMAAFGMGYPIVTGCHNTHRVTALQDVGGFAPHDADDLLLTLLYRARGWRGVYVPQILARGLTPVDWPGYLQQQLRWARSVLDIKLRRYGPLAGKLSWHERLTSFLHGWYYLQGLTTLGSVFLTAYTLVTGSIPTVVNVYTAWQGSRVVAVLMLCEFYRQRFYLDWRHEWGWHWRASVLQWAKWPYLLLAFLQVLGNYQRPYVLTRKGTEGPRHGGAQPLRWFWPHLLVAVGLGTAWIIGIKGGRPIHPFLHVVVAVSVLGNLLLPATAYLRFPAPYDPTLSPETEQVPIGAGSVPK